MLLPGVDHVPLLGAEVDALLTLDWAWCLVEMVWPASVGGRLTEGGYECAVALKRTNVGDRVHCG